MASVNKVVMMGNLTRDPELRYTPKGTAVAEVGLALNRVRTGDDGEKVEDVTFVSVTFWGRLAELANQYLSKGRLVFVEGRLALDEWTDKESGQKRSRLKVVGENLQFLPSGDGGRRESSPASSKDAGSAQRAAEKAAAARTEDLPEDDIPF